MIDPLNLILGLVVAGLVPFIAVVATSFIKISIVLLLVRNALGVQQIPPNMVLNALAVIISGYIMAPVIVETFNILVAGNYRFDSVEAVQEAYSAAKVPLISWLQLHADQRELTFFVEAAEKIWPPEL